MIFFKHLQLVQTSRTRILPAAKSSVIISVLRALH